MSGKPLDRDTRVSVIQCHKLGLQTKDIVKETGVSERSVRRLVAKFKASSSACVPTPAKSTGRPTKINETSLRVLKRCVDVTPTLTARKLKEENPQLLGDVTVRTVSGALHRRLRYKKVAARRKPALNEHQRKTRKAFAKKYLEWPLEKWRSVLWTDESLFIVGDTKGKRVWVRKGVNRDDPKYCALTVKHPPSLMVWGAFGYGGKGPLVVLQKNVMVNQQVYLNILEEHLGECFANSGAEILQHDGAPAHRAHSIKNWLQGNEVEYIPDWPSNSPDLNPIENLWSILKRGLRERNTSTVEKLEAELRAAWERIPASTLQHLADSFPTRLSKIRKTGLSSNK